jgi:acyl-CoA synthetase (AMP-forming)/AMP-acid ligase II
VDIIPKTPNGKMDKKPLRTRFWGESARMVN